MPVQRLDLVTGLFWMAKAVVGRVQSMPPFLSTLSLCFLLFVPFFSPPYSYTLFLSLCYLVLMWNRVAKEAIKQKYLGCKSGYVSGIGAAPINGLAGLSSPVFQKLHYQV